MQLQWKNTWSIHVCFLLVTLLCKLCIRVRTGAVKGDWRSPGEAVEGHLLSNSHKTRAIPGLVGGSWLNGCVSFARIAEMA